MKRRSRLKELLRRAVLLAGLVAYVVPGLGAASGGVCIAGDGSLMPACGSDVANTGGHDRGCCDDRPKAPKPGCCGDETADESGCIDIPAPKGPAAPAPVADPLPLPAFAGPAPELRDVFAAACALGAPAPVADPPPPRIAPAGPFFLRV